MFLIDVVDPNTETTNASVKHEGLVIQSSAPLKHLVQVNEFLLKFTEMDTLERNDFFFALRVDGIAEKIHGPDNTKWFDITVMQVPDPEPQESLHDKCVRMAREASQA